MINPDINRFLGTLLYPISDASLAIEDPFASFFEALPNTFIDFQKSQELQQKKEIIYKNAVGYISRRYSVDAYDQIYQYMERWYLTSRNWRTVEHGALTNQNNLYHVIFRRLWQLSKSMISKLDGKIIYKYWKTDGDAELLGGFDGNHKIHLFRSLTQMLPMDILVAIFAQNHAHAETLLTSFYGNVAITDAPLEQILCKGIAENHLHMGVSTNFSAIWDDWMRTDIVVSGRPKPEPIPLRSLGGQSKSSVYFYYVLARCLRMYMMIYIAPDFQKSGYHIEHFDILNTQKRKKLYQYCITHDDALMEVNRYFCHLEQELSDWITKNAKTYQCWLPSDVYPITEVKFLYEVMRFILHTEDDAHIDIKKCFLDYLRIKHGFFGWLVQDKTITGLDYFQTYYGSVSKGKWYVSKMHTHANDPQTMLFEQLIRAQLATPHIRCIEFRTSIENKESQARKNLVAFLKAYRNILEKEYCVWDFATQCYQPQRQFPRIGIIYHFIKSYQEQPDICGFSGNHSVHAYQQLHDNYHKQIEVFKKLRDSKQYPGIERYLIGIDVASLENTVPTWVFCDIFENARDGKQEVFSNVGGQPFQSVRFTCHAGEDFRHLLSGLRRVYEVVHYLKFHAGDRIGHGLALGISVDDWYQEHQNVILPRIEALENYLWAYQMLSTYPTISSGSDLLYLEQRIHTLSDEIFKNNMDDIRAFSGHIATDVLLQSYEALFHREQFSEKLCNQKNCKKECPLLLEDMKYVSCTSEMIVQAYHCHLYASRMNEPIHYHVPQQEISILKSLQSIMQDMIAKAGIIVEVNPSSNMIISHIDTLHEHPMYQLSKYHCDYKNIMICINSDDPGVFQTNTANELGIAYMGMIEHGIGRNACLEWIERVRESGMRSSFIYQNDSDAVLLRELHALLYSLGNEK